ncbi:MAG: hypothetical protein PVH63_11000 [Balneolaceae bacterium]|jgi:hypothetical protein
MNRVRNLCNIAFLVAIPIIVWTPSNGNAQPTDSSKIRKQILKIRELQRKAHFEKDAELFVSLLADKMISVQNGKVRMMTRNQNMERFRNYFSGVEEFLEWDDIDPPIIKVSRDGTLAWTITRKKVRYLYKDEKGLLNESKTIFAWMSTYEKRKGNWVVTVNVSTREHME